MRVCLYCRIDDTRTTPKAFAAMEAQYRTLKRYADKNGYTIVDEMAEYGSGLTLDRRGLNEVTQTLERGEADALLVNSTAKIVRGNELLAQYLNGLAKHNAQVISITEGIIQEGDIPPKQRIILTHTLLIKGPWTESRDTVLRRHPGTRAFSIAVSAPALITREHLHRYLSQITLPPSWPL